MLRIGFVQLTLMLCSFFACSQAELSPHVKKELKRRVDQHINQGFAVTTIDADQRLNFFNLGTTYSLGQKITSRKSFEIASISKTFTSSLLFKLAQERIISLDAPIAHYLSDSLPDDVKSITIQELITHTSGLPRLVPNFWTADWDNPFHDYTEERLLEDLYNVRLDEKKNWNYSNLGYALLGHIIDQLSSENQLEHYIKTLGLTHTLSQGERIDKGTFPHAFGKTVSFWKFPSFNRYMGGIQSTSQDLAQYLLHQIHHNPGFSPHYSLRDIEVNLADSIFCRRGWMLHKFKNESIIWHNGVSGGYNNFIGYNITTKKGVVMLSNTQRSITEIGLHVLSDRFELDSPKPDLSNELARLLDRKQIQEAKDLWTSYDTTQFDKLWGSIYWLHSHYISRTSFEEALVLNDFMLDAWKDDWEVHFYRGKIYELMGKNADALEQFKHVQKLFPDNGFTHSLIQRIKTN